MKVILCEDIDNLGDMGETVKVAPGYARNYLLPRRLAVSADSASAKQIEHEMRIIRKREEKRRAELAEVAKGMDGLVLEFVAKAGTEGKLFGSITTLHIAQKLAAMGHEVNRKRIQLDEPVKTIGDHPVIVEFKTGIEANITVRVQPDVVEPDTREPEKTAAEQAEAQTTAEKHTPAAAAVAPEGIPEDTSPVPEPIEETDAKDTEPPA